MNHRYALLVVQLLGMLLTLSAVAQADTVMVRSRTGQFVIYGAQANAGFAPARMQQARPFGQGQMFLLMPQNLIAPTNSRLHLEPGLTAVSCERIKEALLSELGERDNAPRKIYIRLNPRIREHDVVIGAAVYEKGWIYSLELPSETDTEFFTAAVLNVLLLDLANRQAAEGQIEIPKWLVSGLIAHLQSTSLRSLALRQHLHVTREQVRRDPLAQARIRFKDNVPLTFEELSWPETLSTNQLAFYRDSAHLFVHELLRLKDGRESLRKFLLELPRHKNWQFAFLAAFNQHFPQLLNVEKWWALNYINLTGRDVTQLWSGDESWKHLKSALDVSVNIHLSTNRLPVAAEVNLQEVILQWEPGRQELALHKSLGKLRTMRMKVHPDYVGLVDGYREVIERYLERRFKPGKNEARRGSLGLNKSTCRQLDALDERRFALRRNVVQNTSAAANP